MTGLLISIFYLIAIFALSFFLLYRLKVTATKPAGGRGYLLAGLLMIFLAAVINFLQQFPGYPNWFLQNIYHAIEIVKFLFLAAGAIFTVIGLALYFSYFGDRDLEVANQLEKYRLLENLQQDSREPFPMAELLERALKSLLAGLGEDAGAIFLLNRSQRQFVLTTASGLSKDEVALLEYYPFGRNLMSEAVEEETPMLTGDFRRLGGKAQLAASRFHSILVMPLISGRNKLGALLLFSEEEKHFSREYLTILGPIADWLAEKIEVSRLGRELGKSQRELEQRRFRLEGFYEKLNRVVKPAGEIPSPSTFAERCLGLMEADEVWLLGLVDGHLNIFGGTAGETDFSESFQAALLGAVARNKPVILNQEGTDESGNPYITRSSLLYPAGNGGNALLLRNRSGAMQPGDDDLKLLELVAGVAGMIIGNALTVAADNSRSRGYETIGHLLRMKISGANIEKELKGFLDEISRSIPSDSIFILYKREGEKYQAIYSHPTSEGLADLSIALGEGIPGQAAIIKNNEVHIGIEAVTDSMARYDEENRNLLLSMFGDRRRPALHAGYPVIINDQADYFISLFGFNDATAENIERHRLISVLVGLLNLRLEIGQSAIAKETAEPPCAGVLPVNIVNDLNNDLAAITGFCQMARRDPNLTGETNAALDAILKSSRQMADKIKTSINENSDRIEGGENRLDINATIKEALDKTKISGDLYLIAGRPFELNLNLSAVPFLPFDREIFVHFLDTAARTFTANISEEEIITLSTYESGRHIYLDISRHRKNFPPVESVSGFGRFWAPAAVEGEQKNAAFMAQLTLLGGEFAFDKYSHIPSYFSFRFPNPVQEPAAAGKGDRQALTILAVDDQVVILELLAAMCQSIGYRILTARNGRDGLALFESHRPDIVIADLVMPGMSGLDLSARIKEIAPETPVIMITGWGVSVDNKKLEEAGVRFLLNKPFRLEQLSDLIGQIRASGV